jgi:hypothetical protein
MDDDDARAGFDDDGAWRSDAAKAQKRVEHLPPEEQLALLAGLVHRVEVMVALRWPTIQRVAEALLRHGYLTRVELDAKQRPRQEPPACSRLHR